jgi:hypothetical protein
VFYHCTTAIGKVVFSVFLPFPLSRCQQQWLNLSPQPWDD